MNRGYALDENRGTGWLYAESRGFILGELEKLGELTVYDRTPEDKVLERIGDAEIVYTNKTPLTRADIL